MVEVVTTDATTPDGSVLEELHEDEAAHEILPHQHLMEMGYVDADLLAESQRRSHVDMVGPVLPDTRMNRRIPPFRKRANAKKLQHFGACTQHEQESKARLRKPCARVSYGERATLAAKSSGFRHCSLQRP